ncbi:MAG: beta-lactamase/D-alanine carboxypeptidase [Methanoregulaceae archaeon PtaB.Bin152]|nr:MAG: beta-lactamase/D-alanine carboxypeptidase [Methanoregulaceae archaeon PtaB.Bin152]
MHWFSRKAARIRGTIRGTAVMRSPYVKEMRAIECVGAIFLLLSVSFPAIFALTLFPGPASAGATSHESLFGQGEALKFFDSMIPGQLAAHHIPGAAVTVVRDGEVVLARGYGYADLEKGVLMDPDRTLVRVGSVSKVLVWIAAMQCAGRGQIDLDADITSYLGKTSLPDSFPGRPVTMRHLMTHSAGFEERVWATFALKSEDLNVPDLLAPHGMPARVRPPGEVPAYSNHGAALAARVIEEVSGLEFATYAQMHILGPLGMWNSTFLQPPPGELQERLSAGYSFARDGIKKQGFEYITLAPSGALSATPSDIGRLMVFLLEEGDVQDTVAGEGSPVARLFEVRFTPDPRIEGWSGGLMEMRRNGRYFLWHGGDTLYSHCLLLLVPDERTGFFVAYNAEGGSIAGHALMQAFIDKFFPPDESTMIHPPGVKCGHSPGYSGTYVSTRSPVTTYEKVFRLSRESGHLIDVRDSPGGGILVLGRTLCESDPGVFVNARGETEAVFRRDAYGNPAYLFLSKRPDAAYSRLEWYEAPHFLGIVAVASQGVFLSVLLCWAGAILLPAGYVKRRVFSARHLLYACLCGISILFFLLFFAVLQWYPAWYGVPFLLPLVLLLVPAILVLAGIATFVTLQAWRRKGEEMRDRIEFTLVTAAAFLFLWWASYWNLPGWNF